MATRRLDRKSSVQTMRIVWLVLLILEIETGRSQEPDLSTVNWPNISSLISSRSRSSATSGGSGNSWNMRASRHLSNQRPCRRCGDECDFEEGNLTCHQVSSFTAECLTSDDCSASIVNLNIVQGRFKNMKDSGLLNALQTLTIRHSDLIQVESLPGIRTLMELNLSNNTHLSAIGWHHIFNRTLRLEKLILANNTLEYIADLITNMTSSTMTTLDLSG